MTIDIETVLSAYIDCALWSSSANRWEGDDVSLSRTDAELAEETRKQMREDVEGFLNGADQAALEFWGDNEGDEAIGHDFWLTRNRHGAGFWDRWSGESEGARAGKKLTDDAHPYGEVYLYIGDDGKIYS